MADPPGGSDANRGEGAAKGGATAPPVGRGTRVYLAGPLFSAAERRFNQRLAERLEAIGLSVFLPQRDGVEADKPPYDAMPREERRRAMFERDVAEILVCDVFCIVLDGRVPDEGACFELGVAFGRRRLRPPGPRLIGLQTDVRAAFLGAQLNPMLAVPLDHLAADEDELLAVLGGVRR